jgi:hypothetical protein
VNIMQLVMNILASGFAGDVGRIYPQATICRFMVSPIGDHMEQDAQTIALFFFVLLFPTKCSVCYNLLQLCNCHASSFNVIFPQALGILEFVDACGMWSLPLVKK